MLVTLVLSLLWMAVAAQEPRYDTTWRDNGFAAPRNFKLTRIRKCDYQLTFERADTDGRYQWYFDTTYNNSSPYTYGRIPVKGGLPISRTTSIHLYFGAGNKSSPPHRYQLSNDRVLSIHEFHNACYRGATGLEPTFKAYAVPAWNYKFRNDFTSGKINITPGEIPGVPQNVAVTRVGRFNQKLNVTWAPVDGATGYFVLASARYPYFEGGIRNDIETVRAGPGATHAVVELSRVDTVAVVARGAQGVVSETRLIPEVAVPPQ